MQEVQYLLTPPPNPPPPQLAIPNPAYNTALPEPPLSLDELYLRQRQKTHQTSAHLATHPSSLEPPMANHHQQMSAPQQHPDTAMVTTAAPPPQHHPYQTEHRQEIPYAPSIASQSPAQTLPLPPQQQLLQLQQPSMHDEPAEQLMHSYDNYGRPASAKQEPSSARSVVKEDPDGWNFDDQHVLPDAPPISDLPQPPRRPDTDLFPSAANMPPKSPTRSGPASHRRKSSTSSGGRSRRSSGSHEIHDSGTDVATKPDHPTFKVKFALRGHLDVVRSVIFTGGGSPSEPELCTAGDDGTIKRWIIPASYANFQHNSANDLDISCYFTHRGHDGIVTSLAACPPTSFATGGRASGDGWIFSGGQDSSIRV